MISRLIRYVISFVIPIRVTKTSSSYHNYLEVVYSQGRLMLNTRKANYSFGGLHRVFQIAFKHINYKDIEVEHILILGFGVGSVASIIQDEYGKTNTSITGVELDPVIVELGKTYFNTDRFKQTDIICSDAHDFVNRTDERFDLIVVDLYEEVNVPEKFETSQFLIRLKDMLSANGQIVFNKVAHTKFHYKQFELLYQRMNEIYQSVTVIDALGMNRVLIAKN